MKRFIFILTVLFAFTFIASQMYAVHGDQRFHRVLTFPAPGINQFFRRLYFLISPEGHVGCIAIRRLHTKPVFAANLQVNFVDRRGPVIHAMKPFLKMPDWFCEKNKAGFIDFSSMQDL